MPKIEIEYTLPLSYIISIVIAVLGIIWSIIKFYFKIGKMNETIKQQETQINLLDKEQKMQMRDLEERLEKVKQGFDEKLSRINNKLDTQKETLIEVKTMVTLLIKDKIK